MRLTAKDLEDLKQKKYSYYIGIDPGVNTGVCAYGTERKEIYLIETLKINEAMDKIKNWHQSYPGEVFIRVEDARKRTWFANAGREKLQGAGSIKRDCQIWEDFLKSIKANYEFVAPKNNKTKLNASQFKLITKWDKQTNQHGRDATFLVFGI